jgi:TRAP-type uncharacterized transport system fused permease subunit
MRIAIAGFIALHDGVFARAAAAGRQLGATAYVVAKALVAIGLWGAAAIGYLLTPLHWAGAPVLPAGGVLLVAAVPWTDEIGCRHRRLRPVARVAHPPVRAAAPA